MKRNINYLKVAFAEKKRANKWLSQQLGKAAGTVSKWRTNTMQSKLETLVGQRSWICDSAPIWSKVE